MQECHGTRAHERQHHACEPGSALNSVCPWPLGELRRGLDALAGAASPPEKTAVRRIAMRCW